MGTIKGLLRRIEAANVDQALHNAFSESADAIEEKNRQQLFEGYDKNQERLKPYRRPRYARVKNAMNPLPGYGNPDFKVTGAFYRGIEVRVEGQEIITNLTDSKSDELLARDPDIIGVGGKYKKELIGDTLQPAFNKEMHKQLKL
jgi:hypothetical protein